MGISWQDILRGVGRGASTAGAMMREHRLEQNAEKKEVIMTNLRSQLDHESKKRLEKLRFDRESTFTRERDDLEFSRRRQLKDEDRMIRQYGSVEAGKIIEIGIKNEDPIQRAASFAVAQTLADLGDGKEPTEQQIGVLQSLPYASQQFLTERLKEKKRINEAHKMNLDLAAQRMKMYQSTIAKNELAMMNYLRFGNEEGRVGLERMMNSTAKTLVSLQGDQKYRSLAVAMADPKTREAIPPSDQRYYHSQGAFIRSLEEQMVRFQLQLNPPTSLDVDSSFFDAPAHEKVTALPADKTIPSHKSGKGLLERSGEKLGAGGIGREIETTAGRIIGNIKEEVGGIKKRIKKEISGEKSLDRPLTKRETAAAMRTGKLKKGQLVIGQDSDGKPKLFRAKSKKRNGEWDFEEV